MQDVLTIISTTDDLLLSARKKQAFREALRREHLREELLDAQERLDKLAQSVEEVSAMVATPIPQYLHRRACLSISQ